MQPPRAHVGDSLDAIETPALIIELDALERNLDVMRGEVARFPGVRLRPHAKTHKSSHVARLQMSRGGAVGMCCQTIGEAEMLVREAGVSDVLLTNQIVSAGKIARLVELTRQGDVAVCVDDPENVTVIAAAAARAGMCLRVLVEVEIGCNRCGVAPGAPAAELAARVTEKPSLRFAGIHAYHGAAQHVYDLTARQTALRQAVEQVADTVEAIRATGLTCDLVTGAGTGSWPIEAGSGVYNEVQPGSYVFMDADYARVEGAPQKFESALFVLTTVISRQPDRVVCDAGLKAHSIDTGPPRVFRRSALTFARASDEHGVIRADPASLPRAGERLLLIPGHCDPTVNLYDHYVCIRHGRVEAVWPITARGV
jgi:3-hydroxy-D-aspartate aldolase